MQIISCSALILDHENDRVLISRRSDNRRVAPGLWEVVGGRLEFGEAPLDCLRREVREELDVAVVSPELSGVYSCLSRIGDEDVHLISLVYTCQIEGIMKPSPAEIAEVRWVSSEDLIGLKFAANCRQRVEEYFQRRSGSSTSPAKAPNMITSS